MPIIALSSSENTNNNCVCEHQSRKFTDEGIFSVFVSRAEQEQSLLKLEDRCGQVKMESVSVEKYCGNSELNFSFQDTISEQQNNR